MSKDFIEFTADEEEPLCHRCDNADMPEKWCIENCGGTNWWACYRRTEVIKDGEYNE